MSIQSLGVGSGLALDDLVKQLLDAERKPKFDRLDSREEALEAKISGIGALKSKLSDFKETLQDLKSTTGLDKRSATVSHPSSSSSDDETSTGAFTAEASNSAVTGSYDIAITQLADGSRIETAAGGSAGGGFDANTDVVTNTASTLTFQVGSKSFDVSVTSGMTLQQLRNAVNDAGDDFNNASNDNFKVTANIINTGTEARLVFTSDATGDGNDLKIINKNDNADLQKVSTHASADAANASPSTGYLAYKEQAKDAKATIDGIEVKSATNKFENVIENVAFTASEVSETDTSPDGFKESTLSIGHDRDGVEKLIRDFVDNYNSLQSEISKLTRYGASELEEDGPLAGDFMARGIQTGLASIFSSNVSESALGTLFSIGITFDDDGKLEISSFDEFGSGSGEDRLKEAMEEKFDEIAKLFTDENEGIAVKAYDFVHQYTTFGGLIPGREDSLKDDKEALNKEREQTELRMLDYEQYLRKKYLNLDQTVAKLNQTRSAMVASLSSLG